MEVKLGADFMLDIATKGEIDDSLESAFKKYDARPIYSTRAASGNVNADNSESFIDLGKPPVGRTWNLCGITVCGADDNTPLANAKVAIYFGDTNVPSITGLKIPALAVPSFQSFSDKVLWCHSTENLVAGISGTATPGAQVLVIAHVAEWIEKEITQHSGR
jgi:hypothetical protein